VNIKEAGLALLACSGTHRSDSGAIVRLSAVGIPSVHGGEDVNFRAYAMPAALQEDAMLVVVRRDGSFIFGNTRILTDELSDRIQESVRERKEGLQ
jgi:hypothetical protein